MKKARNWIVGWVLAKDKETLYNWLAVIELGAIVASVLFAMSLALALTRMEIVQMVRYGIFSLVSLIVLSCLTAYQYLLAIEFNTRKK